AGFAAPAAPSEAGHLNIFPSIIPMGDRGVLAQIRSASVVGLEASMVEVELDVSPGLPTFSIVGLPDTAVREARERVRAAVRNSGYEMPVRRITVNLAPADTRKAGPVFDLPIALGILTATRQIPPDALRGYIVVGELSLDGAVRPVPGVLSIALAARRQDHARPPPPHDPSAADTRGGDRGHPHLQCDRPAAAARSTDHRSSVSRSPPLREPSGAGGWRAAAAPRGGEPRPSRGAVPGRAPGVPARCPRSAAAAAGGRTDRGGPGARRRRVPGALYARRRDEPVPVRPPR